MRMLSIIVYYALALMGCSPPLSVTDVRADVDGGVFHGRVEAREGISRFECIESATGTCRFVVHAARCAPSANTGAACVPPTITRVDVARGGTREILGLPKSARACLAVPTGGRC